MKNIILSLSLISTLYASSDNAIKNASLVLKKWATSSVVKIEFDLTWTQSGKKPTASSRGTVLIKRPQGEEKGAFKLLTSDLEIYKKSPI